MATTDPPPEEIKQVPDTTEQLPEEAIQDMDTTDSEPNTLEINQEPEGSPEVSGEPQASEPPDIESKPSEPPDTESKTSDPPDIESKTSPPSGEIQKAEAIHPESPTEQEVVSKEIDTAPPPSTPEVLFKPGWAPTVSRDVVIDRIRGCIYGNALGDAMGLATEFLSKAEANKQYPGTGPIHFSKIAQDFHR